MRPRRKEPPGGAERSFFIGCEEPDHLKVLQTIRHSSGIAAIRIRSFCSPLDSPDIRITAG